jgi:hypothetical protein
VRRAARLQLAGRGRRWGPCPRRLDELTMRAFRKLLVTVLIFGAYIYGFSALSHWHEAQVGYHPLLGLVLAVVVFLGPVILVWLYERC